MFVFSIAVYNDISRANYLYSDSCIQTLHLGRYILRYTVGNLVLQLRTSEVLKCDIWRYIRRYTSTSENFEYGYPHSNALLQSRLKLERCFVCLYALFDSLRLINNLLLKQVRVFLGWSSTKLG